MSELAVFKAQQGSHRFGLACGLFESSMMLMGEGSGFFDIGHFAIFGVDFSRGIEDAFQIG